MLKNLKYYDSSKQYSRNHSNPAKKKEDLKFVGCKKSTP